MNKLQALITVLLCTSLVGCVSSTDTTGRESYKNFGEQIEDSKIVNFITNKFSSDPFIPHKLIHIAVDRGIVQLSGFIHTYREADLVISVTRNSPGVKDVINNLIVLSSQDYAIRRATAEKYNTPR